jgi:hypothetical protein
MGDEPVCGFLFSSLSLSLLGKEKGEDTGSLLTQAETARRQETHAGGHAGGLMGWHRWPQREGQGRLTWRRVSHADRCVTRQRCDVDGAEERVTARTAQRTGRCHSMKEREPCGSNRQDRGGSDGPACETREPYGRRERGRVGASRVQAPAVELAEQRKVSGI